VESHHFMPGDQLLRQEGKAKTPRRFQGSSAISPEATVGEKVPRGSSR
jgi:hypothetical protein